MVNLDTIWGKECSMVRTKKTICLYCKKEFETSKMNQVHCSVLCKLMCYVQINDDGCWIWHGAKDKDGYGLTSVADRSRRVHRLMWEIKNEKEIPFDQNACHSCDNPCCVNPEHIFLGRSYHNTQDMMEKGRSRFSGSHKVLDTEKVKKIRQLIELGYNDHEISRLFEITPSHIWQIRNNLIWKHVE